MATSAPLKAASPAARPAPRRRARAGAPALLLLPFFILFTACTLIPIGYAVYLSLYDEKRSGLGFGGVHRVFSGFGNYADALGDPAFRDGFVNLGLYCLLYIPLMVVLSLLLALLLDSTLARAKRFFQLALFLPHAVPGIIAALIWMYLYTPGVSPVVGALDSAGFQADILGTPVPAVVNIALWEWTGYNLIIFFAALQAIPREVLEASVVDGAGPLRTALSVKLPLIRPSLAMVGLFTVIGSLQLFTEPMILHGATPDVVTTWTPNMYAYTAAFERDDYGLAAAASVLLALAAAALSYLVTRFSGGRSTEQKGAEA
ncbi:sugar ABC transporter permease [Streptomyces sp. SID11385]|uniref:carbohydrate ABC transporter permease n=1 Tax=Streptomyces sp. SID11385 TaxID=2706031 RepID=UPI0013C7212B|nr:sugar ABC transporter permease [Streptomyces sp. SID11385]NEA37996.1 sugar ABC transporter permease [Streptomyces sp. SID11385]